MWNFKNEQGITLVTVLLLLTVISVLGLAVMGASINNMKQISKTESNIKTTDIAEMGVVYYETQLKSFLNEQLYDQAKQKEIINRYFTNTASTESLIQKFNDQFPIELNNLYKSNNSLFTNSGDRLLPEKTVNENSSFKIKINPDGIKKTTCSPKTPANSQCYRITYDSYGYSGENLEKVLSATFDFSYSININNVEITKGAPPLLPLYEEVINSVPNNLRTCTGADFGKKINGVKCSSNLIPTDIQEIKDSIIVFNKGVNLDHLPNGVMASTLIIHSLDVKNPITIGMFNHSKYKGYGVSSIVVIGNAKLNNQIQKPVNLGIYITGNADLTDFTFKNADLDANKVCVQGTIKPDYKKNTPGVYSSEHPDYNKKCMGESKKVGENSLTIKGEIISPRIDEKSFVTY